MRDQQRARVRQKISAPEQMPKVTAVTPQAGFTNLGATLKSFSKVM
jgi:hypothetical protein